jgi:hypothetical protein
VDSGDERSNDIPLPLAIFDKYDALLPVVTVFVWDLGDHLVAEYDFSISVVPVSLVIVILLLQTGDRDVSFCDVCAGETVTISPYEAD